MANVLNTLYPPLVDTFQSPFLYTDNAEVSFTISPYNSYKEISRLHITLVNQRTNQSVFASGMIQLDETVLTNGVWIVPFNINNSYLKQSYNSKTYTLEIPSGLLKKLTDYENPSYTCDCYYKIQIRFDNCSDEIDGLYLNSKRVHFSEWSAVTLLKAIPEVTVELNNFDVNIGAIKTKTPQYTFGIIPVTGEVSFNPSKTGEYLESFRVEILDINDVIIKESKIQFVEKGTNTFNWLCDLTDAPTGDYIIKLYLATNNHYTIFKKYNFKLIESSLLDFNPIWDFNKVTLPFTDAISSDNTYIPPKQILPLSEDGWVTINISIPNLLPAGYLFVKRASNLDNYLNWEIVNCTYFAEGNNISTTFIDKTVGSLVDYKYSCQYLTTTGIWSKVVKTTEIVYPDFYDILVLEGERQLAIRYNAQITNLTPVVNRIKIDTLGSKYPKFAENAKMHYKQFQLTGLISAEEDYNRKFISDLDYKNEMDIYNQQMNGKYMVRNDTIITTDFENNSWHNRYPINNWWWERKFREEVIEWLNNGEPKLYRSMTEGNMIVMFDAVSLTPNTQLGRRIWNFSATVYEVGDGYSLTELDSLGIYKIKNDFNAKIYNNTNNENIGNLKTFVGQKSHYIAKDESSFMYDDKNSFKTTEEGTTIGGSSLKKEIEDLYSGIYGNYKINKNSIYLTDVKIKFESEPQWYDLTTVNLSKNIAPNSGLILFIGNKEYEFEFNEELKQYVLKNSNNEE